MSITSKIDPCGASYSVFQWTKCIINFYSLFSIWQICHKQVKWIYLKTICLQFGNNSSCGMKSKALEKSVITPLKSAVCFSIFLSFFIFHLSTFLWRGLFGVTCLVYKISIHYLPMLPFDPPENTRKPKFQGNLGPILELNKKNFWKRITKIH